MLENKEDLNARSGRILDFFNSIIGQAVEQFPVPPFSKWLNGRIISAQRGAIEVEFDVRPEMANPTGLLHGGVQCSMMDDVIGMTCATLGYEGLLLSISLHADYLGKVPVGETIRVTATIQREGRNIVYAHADITDGAGNLVATANSNLLHTSHVPDYAKSRPNSESD